MGEVLVLTNPNLNTQRTLDTCALAMIMLATNRGIVDSDNGEIKHVMYVKADVYDYVLTEEITGTESMGEHWLGYPQSTDCREEGTVIIQVRCTKIRCQNVQTGQSMMEEEAKIKVKLMSTRQKRDLNKLRTSHWDTNLFQQWIQYSVKTMFEAKKQKKQDCIACYSAKKLPQIQSLPGSELGGCPDISRCFAFCTVHMAGGLPGWSNNTKVCPKPLSYDNYDVVGALPPVVHKPDNIVFPFCIKPLGGKELEEVAQRTSKVMTDAVGLVRCSRVTWYPKLSNGNATRTIKLCETSPKARIQCKQIVPNEGHVIYERNSSHIAQYRLLDLGKGTKPLGYVFWSCEDNVTMIKVTHIPEIKGVLKTPLKVGNGIGRQQMKIISHGIKSLLVYLRIKPKCGNNCMLHR